MKPLSERDENFHFVNLLQETYHRVGMKPLSERDENVIYIVVVVIVIVASRNEATL